MQKPKQPMTIINLKIIWFALLASNALFVLQLIMRTEKGHPANPRLTVEHIPIVVAVAIIVFIVAIFLPRHRFHKDKLKFLEQNGPIDPKTTNLDIFIPTFATTFIFRLSLFQSVALIGFFLATILNTTYYFYPFGLVSTVAFILNFPKEKMIREAFKGSEFIKIGQAPRIKIVEPEAKPVIQYDDHPKVFVLPLLLIGLHICLISFLHPNLDMQIDHDGLFVGALALAIAGIVLVALGIKKLKFKLRLKTQVGICIFLFIGLLIGIFGSMGLMSFMNQLMDNSIEKSQITSVVEDESQSEESIKANGKCYQLKDNIDPTTNFGRSDLCERTHPGISQKMVNFTFKDGNYNQRWAVKYEVESK